jgi:hypothetical protein
MQNHKVLLHRSTSGIGRRGGGRQNARLEPVHVRMYAHLTTFEPRLGNCITPRKTWFRFIPFGSTHGCTDRWRALQLAVGLHVLSQEVCVWVVSSWAHDQDALTLEDFSNSESCDLRRQPHAWEHARPTLRSLIKSLPIYEGLADAVEVLVKTLGE